MSEKWYEYRPLLALVAAINLIGTYFGFLYYDYMFKNVPWQLWPVVPDSPTATLLFAIALLLLLAGKKTNYLSFLASASVIKYGLWTMFVIVYFPGHFLTPAYAWFYYLMFFLHFGMVVQPVLLYRTIERRRIYLVITLAWFFTNDFFDYALNTGPLAARGLPLGVVSAVTVALSLASALAIYGLGYRFKLKKNK